MKNVLKYSYFILALTLAWSCSNAPKGEKVEAEAATEAATPAATKGVAYQVDVTNSVVTWTGTKPGGAHSGTLKLSGGTINVADGAIIGGKFGLDMNSIKNTDLPAEKQGDLEGHLKNNDFFEVEAHPTGSFAITSVSLSSGTEGATHTVTGNLTLKGITKSITIPANINVTSSGVSAVTPAFTIDRTQWGITYNSGTLASTVKDRIINDEIGLVLQIIAMPAKVQ